MGARFEQGQLVVMACDGHEQVTVGTSVIQIPAPPAPKTWEHVRRVVIRNLGQPISWRNDGTDPTGAAGAKEWKALKDEITVLDGDFGDFRMIRSVDATADADVRIIYYGT